MKDKKDEMEEQKRGVTKEELLKNLADDLKLEMTKRDKREAFDRILCAVVASKQFLKVEDVFDETLALVYERQKLIDKGLI